MAVHSLPNEEWRDIIGYEDYQISSLGRVKVKERDIIYCNGNIYHKKEHLLRINNNGNGYLQVGLSKNNQRKNFLIHRLVAQAFIPNPYNLPQVNHKSEKKDENFVENLEWCDAEYNNSWGTKIERHRSKLTGRKLSEEAIKKRTEKILGQKRSEETKRKMSEAMLSSTRVKRIPIVQIDQEGNVTYWNSGCEIDRVLNKRISPEVSKCCKGKYKQAYGSKWMYLEDYNRMRAGV